LSKKRLTIV